MDTRIKNYVGIAVIAGIVLSVAIGFRYVNSFSKSVTPNRSFSVSGEGKIVAVPDIAELSFGVLTEGGKNLASLQKENTAKVNRIIAFLKENGIEEKDIRTQFYNISPRYQYFSCPPPRPIKDGIQTSMPCPPQEIVGYTINQSVSVKIRQLDKTGDILARVVEKGANTVSGPVFTVDDPTELQNKARMEAVAQAKEKAKAVAGAGGFRLGKLLSLNEGISLPSPISAQFYSKGGYGGEFIDAAIEPGSQEIRVNVTLVYEIK